MHENIKKSDNSMRLDKWLWCARFFKTRSLAVAAINGGKVSVNGERAKPSKLITTGDKINVRRESFRFDLTVLELATTRRSATGAASLYEESRKSITTREQLAAQIKANMSVFPRLKGRPTKRNRRELIKFRSKQ